MSGAISRRRDRNAQSRGVVHYSSAVNTRLRHNDKAIADYDKTIRLLLNAADTYTSRGRRHSNWDTP